MLDLDSPKNLKTVISGSPDTSVYYGHLISTYNFAAPSKSSYILFSRTLFFANRARPSRAKLNSVYGHWLSDFHFSVLYAFAQSSCSRCWLKIISGNHFWQGKRHWKSVTWIWKCYIPFPILIFGLNISCIPIISLAKFNVSHPISHQCCPRVSSILLISPPHCRSLTIGLRDNW